jgi:hypothetical protein
MFTSLFIESKETLETLKIVVFSLLTKTLKLKLSKIGLRLTWASRTGVLDCRPYAFDHTAIDLLLMRVNVGAFDPCLGRWCTGALDCKSPVLDRSHSL